MRPASSALVSLLISLELNLCGTGDSCLITTGGSLSFSSPSLSSSFSLIRLAMVKAFLLGLSVSVKKRELGVGGLEDRGED